MENQVIKSFCKWCNELLPQNHQGKCPNCDRKGKIVSATFKESITIKDFIKLKHVHEYYKKNIKIKWLVTTITVSSPFIGLWIGGWIGAVVGLIIGLITLLIPPSVTKIRETTMSHN